MYMAVESVGVRELRQHLSRYLERAKRGETLEVTDHGEPVARLVPVPEEEDVVARLRAEGRISPGSATGRVADLLPPVKISGRPLSEILREMRDEERF